MSGPAEPPRVVVIGGGISGLAAAYRLSELAAERTQRVVVKLLEAGDRLGGAIATEERDGFLIEHGPDSFITNKPEALELCRRLGLGGRLIPTNPGNRRTLIAWRGRLHPIPEGFHLLAPTRLRSLLGSPLLSWPGKLRMALEWFLPPGPELPDESLADFVTRRFGREALERIAQPMVAGIYTADPQRLSLRATMPQFLEFERKAGSVIRGLRRNRAGRTAESGARYSLFVSLSAGMTSLVEALQHRLSQAGVEIVLGRCVRSIERSPAERESWRVVCSDGTVLPADSVIVSVPAHVAAGVLGGLDAALAGELAEIPYASSGVVNLAYAREDIPAPLNGFGFVVPAVEKRSLIACSFSSVKFPGRAAEGKVLLRGFVGGALAPVLFEREDAAIVGAVRADLAALLGIRAEPLVSTLWRHPRSMPQYHVGHLDRVERIEAHLKDLPGIVLAGNAYRGVGIPDCIRSGARAAEAALAQSNG